MATFANTLNPTPFSFFDTDTDFQTEADALVTFVKRKLGDDILSVELTKKQVWACLEESFLEYSSIINEHSAKSQLMNLMGAPTGSLSGSENRLPRENLEFLLRSAEPYAMEAGIGGSYNTVSGSIDLEKDRQDYDIYSELKDEGGSLIFSSSDNSPRSKLKIREVYHYSPQAGYRFFDTTSAVNYLNNEFAFESFTPETVFYVLPIYEDVLRAGQLNMSNRVRRSHYSYRINGTKIRLYPKPTQADPKNLWIRVAFAPDPYNPSYHDKSIDGISNISNVPFGRLTYSKINSAGRQWVRQLSLALSKELLGHIRSKFSSVPIPGGDLQLDGGTLISEGREDMSDLKTQLREMLDTMTYNRLLADQAEEVENMRRVLSAIPMPIGKAIITG